MPNSNNYNSAIDKQNPHVIAICGGLLSAICVLAGIAVPQEAIWPVFASHFCHLPIFVVGLGFGVYPAMLAGGIATLAVAMGLGISGGPMIQSGLSFFLLSAFPATLFIRQALLNKSKDPMRPNWYPISHVLTWMTVFAILLQIIMKASPIDFDIIGISSLEATMGTLNELARTSAEAHEFARILKAMTPYAPGLLAASWMLAIILNAIVAQALLKLAGRNIREEAMTTGTTPPSFLLLALAISGISAVCLIGNPFGQLAINISVVLTIPFFFAGLSTIHLLCGRRKHGVLILGPLYVFMILIPWMALFIVFMSVFEPWLKINDRFVKADKK